MALAVLDGNQSATTLSSVVTGGEHIVAHSVVSLGSNAISNIATAVSGTTVCVGSISISGTPSVTGSISVLNFPASQSVTFGATTGSVSILNFPSTQTVTFGQAIVSASNITGLNNSVGTDGGTPANTSFIKIGGHQDGSNSVEHIVHVSAGGAMKVDASDSTVTFGAISGTVTIGNTVTIAGTVTANPTGTQTIAGTVTANIPQGAFSVAGIATDEGGGQPINGVQLGYFDAVTDGYLLVNPTNPLPISGTVTANTFALQGTAVTTSNFTSTTASTVLANYNATREVLTIFNEGAGNLHICAGATCTTIAYQVRLSAGDYYEVPNHQTTITHSAVFATAGTARVTEVS
jgi:hypothetical protein